MLALFGALLFWVGLAATVLFAAAVIYLVATGSSADWILFAFTVPPVVVGWLMVRRSNVPFGEAINL